MRVILINRQDKINLDLDLFKKISTYISDKFDGSKNSELDIVFTDKEEIKFLNGKYRKNNNPTDVLSFAYDGSDEEFIKNQKFSIVGEIIISPEVANENVKENKSKNKNTWNFSLEIILLMIHGFLHIYSYDHELKKDKIIMERLEDSILNDVRNLFKI